MAYPRMRRSPGGKKVYTIAVTTMESLGSPGRSLGIPIAGRANCLGKRPVLGHRQADILATIVGIHVQTMALLSNSLISLVGAANGKTTLQLLACGRSQIVSSVADPSCPNVKHQLHLSLLRNTMGNREEIAALP